MRCASVSVGIVDYADLSYSGSEMRLRYAVGDAEAFHRYTSLGWPSEHGSRHCLLRDREAVIERLVAAVDAVGADGPLDLFFLYLSGHGEVSADGSGWFCLVDAQPHLASLDGAAIDRCLTAVDADYVIVFIDCCHAEAVVAGSQSFAIRKDRRARVVAASCRADQRAWEDDGLKRSVFSDILLRALSTDSPLADARGQVDLQARLLPYLRDQVPIATSAIKRGHDQDPVTAGFLSGPLTLPVVSATSLGRPLTVPQAIRAGVRRFLVAGLIAIVVALAIADLMIFHLAVDSTGEVVVRPGFSATYAFLPIHFIANLDTGLSIRDIAPSNDKMLAELALGSMWGTATHRDHHGLKTWLAALQPGLVGATREPLRALAFGESPTLHVDNDRPPIVETLFLAKLRGKSPSEIGRAIYPYDPALPWECAEQVSNQFDFTRLLAEPEVFRRDVEWIAATAPAEPTARAKGLADIVKITAYRALSEKNGEKRLTEFDAFATAVERIAGFSPTNAFRTAAAPFFRSTKGTWCAFHASFAAAIAGGPQDSLAAEAELRTIFQLYDRSKEGDGGSPEQLIAVHGLARLAHHRSLNPATMQALYEMIKRDDADLTAVTPATALLTEIAVCQKLSPDLKALLLDNLRRETSAADFAPLTATNLLARNFAFLDSAQRAKLRQWLAAEAPANALSSRLHEAIGFVALTERIPVDQLGLLQAQLSSISRFPPQATDYRGAPVITASGDLAAIALGRVGQSRTLSADTTERLANFAAARTEIEGREEIVRGLAKQWFGEATDLTEAIRNRLAACRGDANRRALDIEIARSAVMKLPASERKHILDQLIALWLREVEPAQRVALARLIGSVVPD
jgi:Caspase domain